MNIGSIIDHHYRITELIGTGGMAHVYRAVSIATRRNVAVKVLKEEYRDDPDFLRRFERESRAILHFSHPNIVRAYGIGEYEGLPYIIMEYVEGRTLKDILLETGTLSEKRAVDITSQILLALAAAHKEGFVHRDVKPQNVIITGDGTAKLADFGIARDTGADTRTFSGDKVVGSVHYISPEQAMGKDVTAAADLYSAGVMLYELVTGTVPFTADSSVSVALMHISDAPEEPSARNPALSPAINAAILKALQKTPEERFPSAGEMRRVLLLALQNPDETDLSPLPEGSDPVPEDGSETAPSDGQKHELHRHWSVRIASLIVICICAFLGMFFGMRAVLGNSEKNRPITPNLLGKTVAEAEAKAESYGFSVIVGGYETNADMPAGSIMEQDPAVGLSVRAGTDITVTVSLGPEVATVPNLSGKTPEEAKTILAGIGLEVGSVSYRVTEISVGYICDQSPAIGTEMAPGGTVDICVSSTSTVSAAMPEVIGRTLAEALSDLSDTAHVAVYVADNALSSSGVGLVMSQLPVAGETVQTGSSVELTVARNDTQMPCFCDVAFNINIEHPATLLRLTIPETVDGFDYERIVYEAELEKGELVPVSFTAYADTDGPKEVVLYVDGTECKRSEISFAERELP